MTMRIVNVSDKPFEFTFNSTVYGPYAPGQIVSLPDEIGAHAIKRGTVVDEMGNFVKYKVETLDTLKEDRQRFMDIVTYECPFVATGQCDAAPFKSMEDLRAHLETHWQANKPDPELSADKKDDMFGPVSSHRVKGK